MRRWGWMLIGLVLVGCGNGPPPLSPSATLRDVSAAQWQTISPDNKATLVSNMRGGVNPDSCPAALVVASINQSYLSAESRPPFALYQQVLASRPDCVPTYGPAASHASALSVSATISPAAAVAAWYATNGSILSTIARDNHAISVASGAQNLPAMAAACDQLAGDVADAKQVDPIPDPDTAAHFATALQFEGFGAQDCGIGARDVDLRFLRSAVNEFNDANSELALTTAAIRRLSG